MIKKESSLMRIFKKIFHIPTKLPYFIQLDITSCCNLSCEMCPRHHVDQKPTHIDFDTFKKIVDRLEGAEEISLVGLGEPLVYPRIFEAIRYCKSKGLIVKTTTNGLQLNSDEKLKDLISSGLDTVSFSVESIDDKSGGKSHENSKTVQHIERLIELKRELGSDTPKIAIQSVLIKGREKDLYEIIKWGARHNVERVNVLRMTMYFATGLERPNMVEEKIIFKELARLRKKYHVRIDCLQDQFFTGLKGFLYKLGKRFLGLDSACVRLFDYPYITQSGDMIPCCILIDHSFGNILENDIEDVWLGDKAKSFRKNHNKVDLCSKCDNLRIKQIV